MRKTILIFLTGVLSVSLVSAQQVYKWVDSKGKVHYGDVPPVTKTKAKTVDTRSQMKGADNKPGGKCPYAKD
jgi:hypothetical protein